MNIDIEVESNEITKQQRYRNLLIVRRLLLLLGLLLLARQRHPSGCLPLWLANCLVGHLV
jgi:hypothetical protein